MSSQSCPVCGAPLVYATSGVSACGHVRGGTPVPPPAPPPAPARPLQPQPQPQPRPQPQPAWQPQPQSAWQPQPAWPVGPAPKRSGIGFGKLLALLVGAVVVCLVGLGLIGAASRPAGPAAPTHPAAARTPAPSPTVTPPPPANLSGSVSTGEEAVLGSETSEPGQVVTLSTKKGAIPGLSIMIDGDAYAEQTTFRVSTAPITGVDGYDGAVTPISPLITIENGGAYAASPITVTVPATVPTGHFAMGFYLRADGSLEAMPLISETATSVTVATRHFSSFFIADIAEAALPSDIGTGFRAGEDDFQVTNYGTYLTSGGHCTGQSVAEVWYFANRKAAGASQLHGLTDNLGRGGTPAFWRDDRDGLRISASVQRDADFVTPSAKLLERLMKADADRLQWDAFRYAMYVTGQPQLVGLYETGAKGGHEIVAYAATATGLWVADPNYPGQLRTIEWNAKKAEFAPYASGESARSSKHHYDLIGMDAQSALFDWGEVGSRWAQFDSGTVGIDRFEAVIVEIENTHPDGTITYDALTSGTIITTPRLAFSTVSPMSMPVRAVFYAGTDKLRTIDAGKVAPVPLALGATDLGVLIEAQAVTPTADDDGWRFVDFQRFDLMAAPGASPSPSAPQPTVAPTPPPPAKPAKTPKPTPTVDCSNPPNGGQIQRISWELACGGAISP